MSGQSCGKLFKYKNCRACIFLKNGRVFGGIINENNISKLIVTECEERRYIQIGPFGAQKEEKIFIGLAAFPIHTIRLIDIEETSPVTDSEKNIPGSSTRPQSESPMVLLQPAETRLASQMYSPPLLVRVPFNSAVPRPSRPRLPRAY